MIRSIQSLRTTLAGTLAASLLVVAVPASAEFFVIPVPVGKSVAVADVVDLRSGFTDGFIGIDKTDDMRRVESDGGLPAGDFVVPAGRVFVLTGMHLSPEPVGDGFNSVVVEQRLPGSIRTRRYFIARTDATQSYSFSPGLVFPAGSEVRVTNRSTSVTSMRPDIQGYLVDAN